MLVTEPKPKRNRYRPSLALTCTNLDDRGQPCFYTPSRVWALLRLFNYLHDRKPPRDEENALHIQRSRLYGASWEGAAIRRGDIATALSQLPPLAQAVLTQVGIERKALRVVGSSESVSRLYGRPISHATVRQFRIDGVLAMSASLGACRACQREAWES